MKKALLFACLITCLSQFSRAQVLSYDELFRLRTKSFEDINEYLGNKNWRFTSVDDNYSDEKKITWAFNKQINDKATAWLILTITKGSSNILTYKTANIKTINSFRLRLKDNGYVKTSSKVEEYGVFTEYENVNYIVSINSIPEEDTQVGFYVVRIEKKIKPSKPMTELERKKAIERQIRIDSIEMANFAKRWLDSMNLAIEKENLIKKNRVYTSGFSSLRDKPGDYFEVLTSIPANSVIEIIDENFGEFTKVKYENYVGYLPKNIIKKPEES